VYRLDSTKVRTWVIIKNILWGNTVSDYYAPDTAGFIAVFKLFKAGLRNGLVARFVHAPLKQIYIRAASFAKAVPVIGIDKTVRDIVFAFTAVCGL
jgi:hypothetical protein